MKNLVLSILIILSFNLKNAITQNSGYSIVEFKVSSESLKEYFEILNKNFDIDELVEPKYSSENHDGYFYTKCLIKNSELEEVLELIRKSQISYKIIMTNFDNKKHIKRDISQDSNNNNSSSVNNFAKVRSENITLNYYSVEQIYEWMEYIKESYTDIVSLVEIGKSIQNRSLFVMKIGYPPKLNKTKKLFWFDSAIHAREWTTINTAMYTIDKILEEQKVEKSLMNRFLEHFDIYFMVLTNPDGYVYSFSQNQYWRKNMRDYPEKKKCFGVDLNRNFDFEWMKEGSSNYSCSYIFAGNEGNSEPETKAMVNFILSKTPSWISYVSLHSYGGYWLHTVDFPRSFIKRSTFIDICKKPLVSIRAIQNKYKYKYKLGSPIHVLGYSASGSSDRWAMMVANITYSYTIEIGPNDLDGNLYLNGQGFNVRPKDIYKIVRIAYYGIREYLKTFIDKLSSTAKKATEEICSQEYDRMLKTNYK